MMRRLLLVASLLAALACSALAQTEITIGVNFSTTGPAASLGIPMKNSVLLGPTKMGGLPVRYIFLDDKSDTTTAVQNIKRLVSDDHVDLILGPSVTPTSLAVIDTVAEAKVPTMAMGSISGITSPVDAKRRWVFKTIANDDIFAQTMTAHMAKHGIKTISIIAVNDSYGESWIEQIKRFAGEKGIKILDIERFERSDNSTTPQALRLVRANPDAIVISAVGTSAVTPHSSVVERGYKGKIYQTGGAINPEFLRVGGKTVEGSYVVGNPLVVADQLPDGYPTKKTALDFLKLYESKYGGRSVFAVFSWDAMKIVEAAVPVALKSGAKPGTVEFREALRSALEHVRGVVGVGAVYNMSPTDHVGINELGVAVMRVENGAWKLDTSAAF